MSTTPAENKEFTGDLNTGWVIPFGKYKGTNVLDIDITDLKSYMEYIYSESERRKAEIKGDTKTFCDWVHLILRSM
jgi:hypothetical protein